MSRTSIKYLAAGIVLLLAVPAAAQNLTAQQMHSRATNNKQDCIQHWRGVGWPRYATQTRERNATTVCHFRFVLSHNNSARSPDWVIERLDNQTLVAGGPDRPGQAFVQDELVPEPARASDDDYKKNHFGFARGHMAPAEDFNNDIDEMRASFILSNAVPQIDHGFNGSVWKSLEQAVRDAVLARRERNELYVISGPIPRIGASPRRVVTKAMSCSEAIPLVGPAPKRICKAGNTPAAPDCGSAGVAVPVATYKIVFNPRTGDAHAFIMANRHHDRDGVEMPAYLEMHRVKIIAVERLTGIRFFRDLTAEQRAKAMACAAKPFWAPDN